MRDLTIDVGGPVHVADFGGGGQPMVLVHGLGGSHANWLAVAPRLSSAFAVTAPDLPGFGLSEPLGRRTTVGANAEVLDHYLATFDRPVVLVGNSMGGMLSMMVAARRPHRVAALVLVDPALPAPLTTRPNLFVVGAFMTYAVPGVGEAYVRRRAARLGAEGLVKQTMELCTVDVSRVPADVMEAHYELARRRSGLAWPMPSYLEAARSVVAALARRRRYEAMMRAITAPTLLIHGARDRLVPLAAARAAARMNPSWRLDVYDDIGHTPQLEAPDRYVESVLRFCSGVSEDAA